MRARLATGYICYFGCIWAMIALTSGVAAFFAWLEWTIIFHPQECFKLLQTCEVLRVEHRFNVTGPDCLDVFTYEFVLPGLPVVFAQEEELRRKIPGCLLASITVQNATYKPGINPCFRVKELFESESASFNCADVVRANNATGSACQSLLPPVSERFQSRFVTCVVMASVFVSLGCCSQINCFVRLCAGQIREEAVDP